MKVVSAKSAQKLAHGLRKLSHWAASEREGKKRLPVTVLSDPKKYSLRNDRARNSLPDCLDLSPPNGGPDCGGQVHLTVEV